MAVLDLIQQWSPNSVFPERHLSFTPSRSLASLRLSRQEVSLQLIEALQSGPTFMSLFTLTTAAICVL